MVQSRLTKSRPITLYTSISAAMILVSLGQPAHAEPMFMGLGDLPGAPNNAPYEQNSEAWDVSADGTAVAGTGFSTKGLEAFLWTSQGGMTALGQLPSTGDRMSFGNGISADGSTVVGQSTTSGYEDPVYNGFRWTSETGLVNVGAPAAATTVDGSMVVGDWAKMPSRERCFEVRTLRSGHMAMLKGGNLHALMNSTDEDASLFMFGGYD